MAENLARPASPPSSCPSPKQPDWHASPPNTPPDSSAGHTWPSRCAGHTDADATKPSPAGTTTTPDSSPQPEPGNLPQPKGLNFRSFRLDLGKWDSAGRGAGAGPVHDGSIDVCINNPLGRFRRCFR